MISKREIGSFSLSDFVAGKRGTVAMHPLPVHNSPQRVLCQGVLDFQKSGLQVGLKNRVLTAKSRNHAV